MTGLNLNVKHHAVGISNDWLVTAATAIGPMSEYEEQKALKSN